MESIERARKAMALDDCTNANLADEFGAGSDALIGETLTFVLDAIEAEIAEKYMELPVDAEGVRVRVGDEMELISGVKYGKVAGVGDGVFFTNYSIRMNDYHKQFSINSRHVKPRTLEDVLSDAFIECDESYGTNRTEIIAKYATEIRELWKVE